jgi:hypothetical protein
MSTESDSRSATKTRIIKAPVPGGSTLSQRAIRTIAKGRRAANISVLPAN